MDWQENYRENRQERAGDNRPKTPEELRARNARREKPVLDEQTARRQAPRRSGERQNGNGKRRAPAKGNTPGPNRTVRAGQNAAKTRRTKKPRRTAAVPEAEIHWTEPKPFIRKVFILKLAATVAVVLAVILGFSIFFKVDKISVSGTEKYTPEAVWEASGIEKGESLLGLSKAKKVENILSALPYVKEVQIGIKLPDTVNINVVELAVTYGIEDTEGRWWLMDSGGKLVEGVSAAEAGNHTTIVGLVIQNPQIGSMIEPMAEQLPAEAAPAETDPETETEPAAETEPTVATTQTEPAATETGPAVTAPDTMTGSGVSKLEAVTEILQGLEKNNLMGEIDRVDVTYLFNITLWYEDRLEIRLGQPTELGYKVDYMAQAVLQLADYQIGVLDLTFENGEDARFIQADTSDGEET